MIKLLFRLPNNILLKYVDDNIEKLTERDFFKLVAKGIKLPKEYYKKNDIFINSKDVLSWVVLNDPESIFEFNIELFDDEIISLIATSDIVLNDELVNEYKFLLSNKDMRYRVIKDLPHLIKLLTKEQIDDNIIKKLVYNGYKLTEEDIRLFPFLLDNKILYRIALKDNPNLIIYSENLTKEKIDALLESGYIPTEYDYKNYDILRDYPVLLEKSFEKDPRIIVYFREDSINYINTTSAKNRGFIATKEDLEFNPALCKWPSIMNVAVMNEPNLIVYTSYVCPISSDAVSYALSKFNITEEILEAHPELVRNIEIMPHLPHLSKYDINQGIEEQIKIVTSYLNNNDIEGLKDLPFLRKKFLSKTDLEDKLELLKKIYKDISVDIEEKQEKELFLDKLIDGICTLRYKQNKDKYEFGDIVSLHYCFVKTFNMAKNRQDILLLVNRLSNFVNENVYINMIIKRVSELYRLYLSRHGDLLLSDTTEFSNFLLNMHRNMYIKENKKSIYLKISKKFSLSDKKKETIYTRRKLEIISSLIATSQYDKLGITLEQLKEYLYEVRITLINNKKLIKSGNILSDELFEHIEKIYLKKGKIEETDIKDMPSLYSKFICRKYVDINRNFIDKIILSKEDLELEKEKESLALNITNFNIYNQEYYNEILSTLLLTLDEERLKSILVNGDVISELIDIIPFTNIFDELDLKTLVNILDNYPQAKEKIMVKKDVISVFDKFDSLISLCNSYASVNDVHRFALTDKIVKVLGEEQCEQYLDFYLNMLKKKTCFIPPIYVETNNLIFYSGNYADPEKLLIGKRYKDSCIDLNNLAGEATFNECLLELTGDIILVKDKDEKQFKGRIIVIRRGNVVQFIVKESDNFSLDLYKQIAKEIIISSELVGDNIEYVFVNKKSIKDASDELVLNNKDFVLKFPHGDLCSDVILLDSSKSINIDNIESDLKFDIEPEYKYDKFRKKITYNPTETEVNRIRALAIFLEEDKYLKETMLRGFEPFYMEEYDRVICGEEWYVALKKDTKELESVIFPTADEITIQEFNEIRNSIIGDTLNLRGIKK